MLLLAFFSHEDIIEAKNKLWEVSGEEILGEKPKPKDSSTRPEKEAHLFDIINALLKLDKAENSPIIVIDALSLQKIPRSHPEELNNISLIDRLNKMEQNITQIVTTLDQYIAENMVLKEKVEDLSKQKPSFATVVNSTGNPRSNAGLVDTNLTRTDTHSASLNTNINLSTSSRPQSNSQSTRGGSSSGRGQGARGRGRGGPYQQSGTTSTKHLLFPGGETWGSSTSLDRISKSDAGSGFTYQYHHKKKERQKHNKIIRGTATPSSGLTGAPEPSRHLFVYRATQETTVSDLENFAVDKNFTVRNVECMSNQNAKFKSFKLSVPMSEFDRLFEDDLWPEGIRVRRFIPPRNTQYTD